MDMWLIIYSNPSLDAVNEVHNIVFSPEEVEEKVNTIFSANMGINLIKVEKWYMEEGSSEATFYSIENHWRDDWKEKRR